MVLGIAAILVSAAAMPASAAVTPEQKCETAKNKAAGKYASCLQSAQKNLIVGADTAAYDAAIAKCDGTLTAAWDKAAAAAAATAGSCTDTASLADLKAVIGEGAANVAGALAGGDLFVCSLCAVLGDGADCDDGDACTQSDTCQAGACVGTDPVVCAAPGECHLAGTCNPSTGLCSDPLATDGSDCDDGNGCTQTDTCTAGTCLGSYPVVCTPLDSCHVAGTCDPETGVCSNPLPPVSIVSLYEDTTPLNLDGATPTILEGSVDLLLDLTVDDPERCANPSLPPLTYEWTINTPAVNGYRARGITGTSTPTLSILADSIPNFIPNSIVLIVRVTRPETGVDLTTASRGLYRNSALTLGQATTCQNRCTVGFGCDIENALRPLEDCD